MSLDRKHLETYAKASRAYAAAKPINATPNRTLTNASSAKPYQPDSWPVRAGADDHAQIRSRGFV